MAQRLHPAGSSTASMVCLQAPPLSKCTATVSSTASAALKSTCGTATKCGSSTWPHPAPDPPISRARLTGTGGHARLHPDHQSAASRCEKGTGRAACHAAQRVSQPNLLQVVKVIAECAFVASPYPVILSLEDHCSIPQQEARRSFLSGTDRRQASHLAFPDCGGSVQGVFRRPSADGTVGG